MANSLNRSEGTATSPQLWIALVDDDLSVRRSVPRLLGSAGCNTRAFSSAQELIESGFGREADCLLLDIHLERSTGFELLEQLRQQGVTAPAIFITAYDDEATAERARSLGAAAYLRKPFDGSTLLDTVFKAVSNSPRSKTPT
jgi:FixJ family two-component response regulator